MNRAWIICDRGRKIRETSGQKRIYGTSRTNNCPFVCKAFLRDSGWILEVLNGSHNYTPTLPVAHPSLRKLEMIHERREVIKERTRTRDTPAQIIQGFHLREDEDNSTFKARDIYNEKAAIRRECLGPLTLTQHVLRYLHSGGWYVKYLKDQMDRVIHLFFSKTSCHKILKAHSKVVIMDCTYKTNRYKTPLLVITGSTAINSSFYIAFCFLAQEEKEDYMWAL